MSLPWSKFEIGGVVAGFLAYLMQWFVFVLEPYKPFHVADFSQTDFLKTVVSVLVLLVVIAIVVVTRNKYAKYFGGAKVFFLLVGYIPFIISILVAIALGIQTYDFDRATAFVAWSYLMLVGLPFSVAFDGLNIFHWSVFYLMPLTFVFGAVLWSFVIGVIWKRVKTIYGK